MRKVVLTILNCKSEYRVSYPKAFKIRHFDIRHRIVAYRMRRSHFVSENRITSLTHANG